MPRGKALQAPVRSKSKINVSTGFLTLTIAVCFLIVIGVFGWQLAAMVIRFPKPPILDATNSITLVQPGDWVKLRGTNLTTSVTVLGASYPILQATTSDSNRRLDFKVDPREKPRTYRVYVKNNDGVSNWLSLKVIDPAKLIKIAVIITKAPGAPDPDVTKAGIDETLNEIKKFTIENSYDQADVVWDIFGPYEAGHMIGENLKPNSWVIADPFIDFRKYTTIFSIDDRNPVEECGDIAACGFPKQTVDFTQDKPLAIARFFVGPFFVKPVPLDAYSRVIGIDHGVAVHEFGHSLGFNHALPYNCKTKPIDDPKNCTITGLENFDIMGTMLTKGEFNIINKELVGWATESNGKIKKVTKSGIYRLYPLEKGLGPVGLKIPRRLKTEGCSTMDEKRDYYYLEFRTPTGYDKYVINVEGSNYIGPIGPQVRFLNYNTLWTNKNFEETLNVDMTPKNTTTRDNNVITTGSPFSDPIRGITVSVVTTTPDYTDVSIDLGHKACLTP